MDQKERKRRYDAKRYKRDKKKAEIRSKRWGKENPEKKRAGNARWYQNNKERLKRKAKKYYSKNKSECKKRMKAYRRAHPEVDKAKHAKRKAQKLGNGGSFTASEWKALCKKHHNRCLGCGKRRKLTADHVVPVSKGGSSNISNIQPLCGPCNSSKGNKTIDYRNGGTNKHGKRN
jgi:5-methylcytosine-specific restriction endonuclease McrA